MQEKLKTGIDTLDAILDGGIPKSHSVLLSGSCGTGKTIVSQIFLFEGAKKGETGMYISLSEPPDKMIKNLEDFKFFDIKLIRNGKIRIVDITQDSRLKGMDPTDVRGVINLIRSMIQEADAQRVVIDSVTAISRAMGEDQKVREFIMELGFQLCYLGCTSIMISEIPPQQFMYSIYGIEEFIVDGVILLSEFEQKSDLLRTLQVIKMRGVNHSRSKHLMKISNEGIELVPMFEQ